MSDKRVSKKKKWSLLGKVNATRLLPLGFLVIVLLGACLLTLPAAATDGESIGFFKALFTATSAVCVTGLTVVETGLVFSLFGQIVIILLIQIGGLGFVSIITILSVALGRNITLRERMLIKEAMNENNIGGMVKLIKWVVKLTFICEGAGAALLAIRFTGEFGVAKGIYYAIFHAVSAFCNAGFDILGEGVSISRYAGDPLVTLTVAALVINGGLGFGVINDVITARRFSKFRLHTKIVLTMTAALLIAGTAVVLALEWGNPETLGAMGVPGKLLAAFFQSVTLRTAGFFTVSQQALEPATKFIGSVLMFTGAAPASTGGGMKVTTITILVLLAISIIRGRRDVTAFGRTIPEDIIRRAMAVFMTGITMMIAGTVLVSALHPEIALIDILYECVSAICTVGITSAGTANFCTAAQFIIIVLMFIGRVGPLTLTLAVGMRQQSSGKGMRLPEENVAVG